MFGYNHIFSGLQKKRNPVPDSAEAKAVVLVYMQANNNLEQEALDCINSMEQGSLNIDGILLAYIKTTNAKSYLLKIKYDNDEYRIISDTVQTFSNNEYSYPTFLKDVVTFTQAKYPSKSFGLILWSHATSWAPPSTALPKTESFGYDRGREMDIFELRDVLPNNLDFLIFDACSMSSLEVLFEFKDKAKYIIASSSETMAESFPYKEITPFLFQGLEGLKNVAKGYFKHYSAYNGLRQSATVSLIKTDELNLLATEMKSLIVKEKAYGETFISQDVQRLDFTTGFPVPLYDFGDFLTKNFGNEKSQATISQTNNAILYKANTPNFLGKPISAYSGVTCYIPALNGLYFEYYKRFKWYRSSGLYTLFEQ